MYIDDFLETKNLEFKKCITGLIYEHNPLLDYSLFLKFCDDANEIVHPLKIYFTKESFNYLKNTVSKNQSLESYTTSLVNPVVAICEDFNDGELKLDLKENKLIIDESTLKKYLKHSI